MCTNTGYDGCVRFFLGGDGVYVCLCVCTDMVVVYVLGRLSRKGGLEGVIIGRGGNGGVIEGRESREGNRKGTRSP